MPLGHTRRFFGAHATKTRLYYIIITSPRVSFTARCNATTTTTTTTNKFAITTPKSAGPTSHNAAERGGGGGNDLHIWRLPFAQPKHTQTKTQHTHTHFPFGIAERSTQYKHARFRDGGRQVRRRVCVSLNRMCAAERYVQKCPQALNRESTHTRTQPSCTCTHINTGRSRHITSSHSDCVQRKYQTHAQPHRTQLCGIWACGVAVAATAAVAAVAAADDDVVVVSLSLRAGFASYQANSAAECNYLVAY